MQTPRVMLLILALIAAGCFFYAAFAAPREPLDSTARMEIFRASTIFDYSGGQAVL